MSIQISTVDKFTKVKQRRDDLSRLMATLQGKLDGSRDRYNAVMRELAVYKIGSLAELQIKIQELDAQILSGLQEAEELLNKLEAELTALEA